MNARQGGSMPAMPFADLKAQYLALKSQIDARIQRVLDHGQYIMGPEVQELEDRLASYTGARHCITVASGTEALLIALMALGLRPGDEVITTAFSFAATAEMIALLGGKPVFVDIEPDTCNIDAALIEPAITARTKAVMPVSLYGQCADMDAINAIAGRHGIAVIEDAAQSFGATYGGRKSGHLSTLGCTSFFPSKPLGCYGDGGAIFTDDDELAQACREIRVHGQSGRYQHTRVGVGGRMDTLQCAIVLAKLESLHPSRWRDHVCRSGVATPCACIWRLAHRASQRQWVDAGVAEGVIVDVHWGAGGADPRLRHLRDRTPDGWLSGRAAAVLAGSVDGSVVAGAWRWRRDCAVGRVGSVDAAAGMRRLLLLYTYWRGGALVWWRARCHPAVLRRCVCTGMND